MRSAPRFLALLAFFALTAGLASPLWAATGNVSNLNLTASRGIAITAIYPSAQAFRTGTDSDVYALESVTLKLGTQISGSNTSPTVSLYSVSGGNPNASLATLATTQVSNRTLRDYVFSCSSGCRLTKDTPYTIVVTPAGAGPVHWGQNSSGTETNTPSNADWTIADDAKFQNGYNGPWQSDGAVKLMKVSWATEPGKVAGLTAVAGNEASVDVNWTATAGATSYKVQYKSDSQDWSSTRQFTPTTNSHNVASTYLTANTAYTFRVAATNTAGDGLWSDEVMATPVEATLQASSVEASTATLTIANHTGTWYHKRITPTAGTCSSGVSTASTSVSGLSPGRTHTFSAYADSQCTGTVLATSPQFLAKPDKPTGVTATAANGALDVAWTATTGASSYKIQWKSSSDSDWDATSRQITSTAASANIPSLTNGTTYTVRVAAVNDTGDGAWSDTATGTPSGVYLESISSGLTTSGAQFWFRNSDGSNYSGTWYFKATPPANASCVTRPVALAQITGKNSATHHTITAYSDSGCTVKLTSLDFTTLPAQVTGVTATARIGALDLGWTAESGSAPVSYKVQWKSGAQTWDAGRQVVTTKAYTTLGLVNGTQYTIRVAATTAGRDGAWSYDTTGTPSGTALTLTATPASNGASFALYNHTGNFSYKVTPPSTANCIDGSTITGTPRNFSDNTKSAGAEHNIAVYSDTACSTQLASVDFITLPAKTTGVTLSNQGASLGVKWTAVTGAASYKVQWKSSSDSGWDATNRQVISGSTSAVIYSLTNGTAYTVRVAAVNADGGDGDWSDTATLTPTVTLTESNVTATGAKLTVAGHTGTAYLSARGGNSQSLACTAASGGTHSPTLQGNTTYEFKAYSNSGCTGTALASTTFTTPGAVTLIADNIRQHYVMLYLQGWETLPETRVSYLVHEAGSSSPHRRCDADSRPRAHYPYTGLEPGTTYTAQYFRGNSCAAIEQLASVTFTTLSAAAPELSVSNVANTGATLTLANHAGDWWYENNDVANSCAAVTGGAMTAHLSGLTANTNYSFTAWSHAGCADSTESGVWYSKKVFTTTGPLTVSVSDKTSTGLTVNLRGYTEANGYPEQWSVAVGWRNFSGVVVDAPCQTLPRATTSATVTSLEAGKQYTIQIYKVAKCVNPVNIVNETPVTTVSLVSGSVGPSSASLTLGNHEGAWSYKGGEASGNASGAGAQSTGGAGAQWGGGDAGGQCQGMTAGQYTAKLTGLKSDTSYAYTAYNGADCSGRELAQAAFATPPPPVPDAPTGLSAAAGDASVTLSWSDPVDSSVTGYEYQVNHNDTDTGRFTGWGDWTAIDGSGADTTSHAVTGLTNANEYRFRLRAVNDAGASANAPRADPWYVSATPEAPVNPVAPEPPASVSVTRADGVLNASWPAVEGATSYHITYTSNDGASWNLAAENHPDNSITITGADNALTYVVGVRARNEAGDSGWINSPPAGPFSAEPPATPSSVTVTRGDGTLEASWPAVEGATSYHVTYSSDNGASWSLAALHHRETSIEITGVDNALTYIVGVRARNEHGDSGWRNSPPAEPADKSPQFGQASIGDLRLEQGKAMDPVTLPAASGGNGPLSYALSGELPAGLAFDASTRVLSGRPAQAMAPRRFEYTATDADASEPDVARLSFGITVAVSAEDKAVVEDALAAQGRAMLTGVTSVIGERFRALSDDAGEDIRPDLDRDPATAALNTLATWLSGQAGSACQPTRGAGLPGNEGTRHVLVGPSSRAGTPSLPEKALVEEPTSSYSRTASGHHKPQSLSIAMLDNMDAPGCDGPQPNGSAMHSNPRLEPRRPDQRTLVRHAAERRPLDAVEHGRLPELRLQPVRRRRVLALLRRGQALRNQLARGRGPVAQPRRVRLLRAGPRRQPQDAALEPAPLRARRNRQRHAALGHRRLRPRQGGRRHWRELRRRRGHAIRQRWCGREHRRRRGVRPGRGHRR